MGRADGFGVFRLTRSLILSGYPCHGRTGRPASRRAVGYRSRSRNLATVGTSLGLQVISPGMSRLIWSRRSSMDATQVRSPRRASSIAGVVSGFGATLAEAA